MFLLQLLRYNFQGWGRDIVLTYLFIAKHKTSVSVLQFQPTMSHPSDEAPFNPYVLPRKRGLIGAEKGRQSNLYH